MKASICHIFDLGIKEIIGLFRDPLLLVLIIYSFTISIYVTAKSMPDAIDHAAVAIVDEDESPLSKRVTDAFIPPLFRTPEKISRPDIDKVLDSGLYTFVIVFPPNFQEKVLANNNPEVQINVDATRMSQAFTGNGYIQQIILKEVNAFLKEQGGNMPLYTAGAVIRNRFNPNLIKAWQGALSGLANNIAMIALILTGAALIRERERGTLEHLLVMPVTPLEIMLSKVWSMTLVVLVSSFAALVAVIHHSIGVPMTGSVTLFMFGILLSLFTVTSLGIFLACFAKDMPQLGILIILVLLPMQILSGGMTPQSSMPEAVQFIMKFAPTTYIVKLSKAVVLRGAGFAMLWDVYLEMLLLGSLYFFIALKRFRRTVAG